MKSRKNRRFVPGPFTLETRISPSGLDIPFPDPIDYPEDIPPYEPPTPPGGPSTPK